MIDKETLARRVDPSGGDTARMIRAETTQIHQYDTPFFRRGAVYRVVYFLPHKPVNLVFGCAEPDFAISLAHSPEAFFTLAEKAGLDLGSSELRLKYVQTLLETTGNLSQRFQVLRSYSEMQIVTRPTEEEVARYKQLEAKFDGVIRAPKVSDQPPWNVSLFALKAQDLVEIQGKLYPNGKVETAVTVLEKDMPVDTVK
ncbi:MAG TPA: hypothetical protein VLH09_06265 [Bryobacteraceae bacterium]|nr:hypothetical protein [Bryobacteraceae bacterium]